MVSSTTARSSPAACLFLRRRGARAGTRPWFNMTEYLSSTDREPLPPARLERHTVGMNDVRTSLDRWAFPFTDEQRLVADAARDFAIRRLAPGAAERDRTGAFPLEHIQELAGLGLLAMKVPASEGGSDTDNVG